MLRELSRLEVANFEPELRQCTLRSFVRKRCHCAGPELWERASHFALRAPQRGRFDTHNLRGFTFVLQCFRHANERPFELQFGERKRNQPRTYKWRPTKHANDSQKARHKLQVSCSASWAAAPWTRIASRLPRPLPCQLGKKNHSGHFQTRTKLAWLC